jgi:hypothetical protein
MSSLPCSAVLDTRDTAKVAEHGKACFYGSARHVLGPFKSKRNKKLCFKPFKKKSKKHKSMLVLYIHALTFS